MFDLVMTIIMLVLLLAAAAFFIVYFWRKKYPRVPKQKGRDYKTQGAARAMGRFARSNGFRFIAPATLKRGDATAKLNAVVVGYFGVLGVVALGYNGDIYGEEKDANWTQVTPDGKRRAFPNPLLEAAADVRVIRDALFAKKLKKVPVEVACVFTNKDAQLVLPRSIANLRMKDLRARLGKEKYLADTGLDMDAVEEAIKEALDTGGKS